MDRAERPAAWLFLLCSLLLIRTSGAGAQERSGPELADEKLFFPACPAYSATYTFDCYHDYPEVTAFLEAAEEAHPELASLTSLGESYLGGTCGS
ncbi:MAG: hypothetical protein ABEJ00_03140 [Gemmatimonadota bacterium]